MTPYPEITSVASHRLLALQAKRHLDLGVLGTSIDEANTLTSRLAKLNDALDYSKIESGNLDLQSIPFILQNAIEDVLDLFKHSMSSKKIEILIWVDPASPPARRKS